MDLREARPVRRALVSTTAAALAAGLVAGLAACTPSAGPTAPSPSAARAAEVRDLKIHAVTLPSADPAELALTASQLVFERSPVIVVATRGDDVAAPAMTAVATALHAPVLLADGPDDRGVRSEAERLGARAAVIVEEDPAELAVDTGASAAPSAAEGAARAAGLQAVRLDPDSVVPGGAADGAATGGPDDAAVAVDRRRLDELRTQLGDVLPEAEPSLLTEVLALVDPQPGQEAALATLRAAGAVTEPAPGGDPGASGTTVRTLSDAQALSVVGVGPGFADADTFAWQVAAAEGGQLLPTGSQRVLPAQFDAVSARVGNAQDRLLAATDTASADGTPVVPTLVLRAAARQWSAGPERTYVSTETVEALTPIVEAARRSNRYVVLELEGGSIALVDQVRALEPLLVQGGVGLLVHPEQRRSGAGLTRGGSVPAAELQAVVDYLAGLATQKALPQVLLAVHSLDSAVDGADTLTQRPQVGVVDASVLAGAQ
ncbi:hypothetical protein [Xylanimonas sp. McL0601]|uniref:hypothetical protein n=1 Tax=Xylanimonas sp. McL0601 TaxID=3414739 RepID=UPI003CF11467